MCRWILALLLICNLFEVCIGMSCLCVRICPNETSLLNSDTKVNLIINLFHPEKERLRVETLTYCSLDMFEAGTETVASTRGRWALLLMMKDPEVQSRCYVTPTQLDTIWEVVRDDVVLK